MRWECSQPRAERARFEEAETPGRAEKRTIRAPQAAGNRLQVGHVAVVDAAPADGRREDGGLRVAPAEADGPATLLPDRESGGRGR